MKSHNLLLETTETNLTDDMSTCRTGTRGRPARDFDETGQAGRMVQSRRLCCSVPRYSGDSILQCGYGVRSSCCTLRNAKRLTFELTKLWQKKQERGASKMKIATANTP